MIKNIIACDLGGTKCAAGLLEYDTNTQLIHCKKRYSIKLAATTCLEDLIEQLTDQLEYSFAETDAICIGAAGQFNGEYLNYTGNYPYSMHFAQVAKTNNWPVYSIVHDYAPMVCATFTEHIHQPNQVKFLNHCQPNPHGRRVAVGVGTGLGMKDGVLLKNGDFWLGQNEIGHIGLITPPHANQDYLSLHANLTKFLQSTEKTALTFEKILSGSGMHRLQQFFCPQQKTLTDEQLGEFLLTPQASELKAAFAWYLGLFIGTVQLIFMPEGGIWLAGGVLLTHTDILEYQEFKAGIEASPAYLDLRQQYPLGLLSHPDHALVGGAYYAVKRLLCI